MSLASKTTCAVIVALLMPLAASARLEFRMQRDGEPLPGSELCFSRFDGKAPTIFAKYFNNAPVRCISGDFVLDVPPGKWTYFARNQHGFVSRDRAIFQYAGGPENTYSLATMEMAEAAWVDFSDIRRTLAKDERAYAVTAPTSERLQTVIPLLDGESSVMVPGGAVTVPVIARNGAIVRVGAPMQLAVSDIGTARFSDTRRIVVAWTQVDAGNPIERVKALRDIAPPDVVLTSGEGVEMKPAYPITWGHDTQETLQFFVDVPPGDVRITLRGTAWTGATVVAHGDGPLVIAPPLQVKPAAVVKVSAIVPPTPRASCDDESKVDGPTIALLRCPRDVDPSDSRERCTEIAKRQGAIAELGSLTPGDYIVELQQSPFRPVYEPVTAEIGKVHDLEVRLAARMLLGRITRRGLPVRARLDLERFLSTTGDGGEFSLPYPDSTIEGRPLRITACDGSFSYGHVFTSEPIPNVPYDIAVPDSAVKVSVIGNDNAVANARVRYTVIAKGDHVRWSQSAHTNADGIATFDPVSITLPIRFCAFADAYEYACSDPIEWKERDTVRELTLRLKPTYSQRGRVVASRALVGGRLYWTAPDGSVTESVNVNDDGTFALAHPHHESEPVVIVSFSHPLVLTTAAHNDAGEWLLALPDVATTMLRVELRNARDLPSIVAVHLAGHHVPLDALLYHQSARQLGYLLRGHSLVIPDIALQEPLTVILGPDMTAMQARGATNFNEPLCAIYESRPANRDGMVIFD